MVSLLKMLSKYRMYAISALAPLAVGFVYLSGVFPFLDIVELKTIDLRFLLRGEIAPSSDIVLAAVDEKSIDREGKWPWPRARIADLVDRLGDAGVKAVAFDIGFLEPDDLRIVRALEKVEQKAVELQAGDADFLSFLEDLKSRSDNDRVLSDAISRSPAKIVLGFFFHTDPDSAPHMKDRSNEAFAEGIGGARYGFVRYSSKEATRAPVVEAFAPQPNIAPISESTPYSGFFNMTADPDGVVRRIAAAVEYRDEFYAPLSLAAAAVWSEEPLSLYLDEDGVEALKLGERAIPCDEYGGVMLNYRGPRNTYPCVSATEILRGEADPARLKGKIVLLGVTAVAVYDLRIVPFGGVFPGLEIHANFLDNIFRGDALYQPRWFWIPNLFLILLYGFFLGVFLQRSDAVAGGVAASILFFGHMALCLFFFCGRGWVLNQTYPLLVVVLAYTGLVSYRYFSESRQKRFVRETFSTFVCAEVVEQLIESPDRVVLGGEEREITAFFSDVQGFTSISEKLSPQELVELLNEFLTEMADIVMKHRGMVDKFEGDAIIAMFGAPSRLSNHSEAACLASIEMQKRLEELRSLWKERDKPQLRMRIGLHSGSAVVGNMGSRNRMDYTMMGDTVNTAARLEGVNKVYGTYTMMGESTRRAAGDWIAAREIDQIRVVGKGEPVRVFELLGYPEDVDDLMSEAAGNYTRGLYAYRAGDWNRAIIFFNKALAAMPDDEPSRVMLKRANFFKIHPPGKNWDGSFNLKSK